MTPAPILRQGRTWCSIYAHQIYGAVFTMKGKQWYLDLYLYWYIWYLYLNIYDICIYIWCSMITVWYFCGRVIVEQRQNPDAQRQPASPADQLHSPKYKSRKIERKTKGPKRQKHKNIIKIQTDKRTKIQKVCQPY